LRRRARGSTIDVALFDATLDPIRIALIRLDGWTGGIVKDIVSRAGFAVAGEFGEGIGLLEAVEESGADSVIVDARNADRHEVTRLLDSRPRTKVLAVGTDGRHSYLYELRPHLVRLGDVSETTLVEAVRPSVWAWQ
jgi:DNA-binding NarL/FixJ family response regulator